MTFEQIAWSAGLLFVVALSLWLSLRTPRPRSK